MEMNNIYNVDCMEGLKTLPDNSIDFIITSPPYDNIRSYKSDDFDNVWNFDKFKNIATEITRVLKQGRFVVWVVGDATVDGSETGTSFRQALYFMECGLKLHDTMIYEKNSSTFPAKRTSKRYTQIFEYMFVFVKGKPRTDIELIADKPNKWAGHTNWGTQTLYNKNCDKIERTQKIKPIPQYSLRNNIWKYSVGFNDKTNHPAVFPEKLAEDHIKSWTKEGDLVLDPFMGSGTTAKMALLNNRKYLGFEMNEEYCNEAIERVSRYNNPKKLFV